MKDGLLQPDSKFEMYQGQEIKKCYLYLSINLHNDLEKFIYVVKF